jgi:hypothetical protein
MLKVVDDNSLYNILLNSIVYIPAVSVVKFNIPSSIADNPAILSLSNNISTDVFNGTDEKEILLDEFIQYDKVLYCRGRVGNSFTSAADKSK